MTEKTRRRQAALDLANEVRESLNLPPVNKLYAGDKGQANSCPITETIYNGDLDRRKYEVATTYWGVTVGRTEGFDNEVARLRHTPASREFVRRFDKGEFPTLVKDRVKVKK